ncbi:MAG TPA: hypothetical protein VFS00_17125 [Polyangiaceae bacterium]|nr:hypothetical protein [Polyangiaceae bacterium]
MKTTDLLLLGVLGALSAPPLLLACRHEDDCTQGATRCRGASAEICDAGGRWGPFLDCGELASEDGSAFACCVAAPAAGPDVTCLPVADCEAGRGR